MGRKGVLDCNNARGGSKMTFLKKTEEFITEEKLIDKGEVIVIGVSGGADSVCLFFLMLEYRKKWGISFHVVHVNHKIRGEQADKDAEFVKNLCEIHEIPFTLIEKPVSIMAKKMGKSEEEMGREVRYDAFWSVAKATGAKKIAVAHHKNDQAETLLHHLCRGSGVEGLAAMRSKKNGIIRPLLCVTREEIELYLREICQNYCVDETNFENVYTRNKLRNEVIPYLESINQKAVEHIADATLQLGEVADYLNKIVKEAYNSMVEKIENESIILWLRPFAEQEDLIQKWLIKDILYQMAGKKKDIGQIHIKDVKALIQRQVGRKIDLPYGIQVYRGQEKLVFERKSVECQQNGFCGQQYQGKLQLDKLGECMNREVVCLENQYFCVKAKVFFVEKSRKEPEIYLSGNEKNSCTKWFDYDKIENTVYFRKGKKQDYVVIDSLGHRKFFNKLCRDAKVSAKEREQLWVVAQEEHLLWVPGVRHSMFYQVSNETKRVLQLMIQERNLETTGYSKEKKDGEK